MDKEVSRCRYTENVGDIQLSGSAVITRDGCRYTENVGDIQRSQLVRKVILGVGTLKIEVIYNSCLMLNESLGMLNHQIGRMFLRNESRSLKYY